jgi:hypothetical protein
MASGRRSGGVTPSLEGLHAAGCVPGLRNTPGAIASAATNIDLTRLPLSRAAAGRRAGARRRADRLLELVSGSASQRGFAIGCSPSIASLQLHNVPEFLYAFGLVRADTVWRLRTPASESTYCGVRARHVIRMLRI